jgi:hypothetical protein
MLFALHDWPGTRQPPCSKLLWVAHGIAADGGGSNAPHSGRKDVDRRHQTRAGKGQVWNETRELHRCTINSQSLAETTMILRYYYVHTTTTTSRYVVVSHYVSPMSALVRWSILAAHHPRPPTRFSHARHRSDSDYLVGGIRLAVPHGGLHQ